MARAVFLLALLWPSTRFPLDCSFHVSSASQPMEGWVLLHSKPLPLEHSSFYLALEGELEGEVFKGYGFPITSMHITLPQIQSCGSEPICSRGWEVSSYIPRGGEHRVGNTWRLSCRFPVMCASPKCFSSPLLQHPESFMICADEM